MHTLKQPLPEALASLLSARGFHTLTAVQRAVLSAGTGDMLVTSRTGSGKTLAYGLALARDLTAAPAPADSAPRALVLAPTRELALQVHGELAWLVSATGLSAAVCCGGQPLNREIARLRAGADVVVACPGRLRDHAARGSLPLDRIALVVLDEVDELLRQGFRPDVEALLTAVGPERRTLLFGATVTPEIEALSRRFQRDRVRVRIGTEAARPETVHEAITVGAGRRNAALETLLRFHAPEAALVFCARRSGAAELCDWLRQRGFAAVCLTGALRQAERDAAMAALRSGGAQICVATDLAARGIDVPAVSLVVHADPPGDAASLVHRSGRTGRARRAGHAIVLAAPRARRRLARLAGQAGQALVWGRLPDPAVLLQRDLERATADPAFAAEPADDERHLAAALLAAHGAERVAAVCARLWRVGLPGGGAGALTPPGGRL